MKYIASEMNVARFENVDVITASVAVTTTTEMSTIKGDLPTDWG